MKKSSLVVLSLATAALIFTGVSCSCGKRTPSETTTLPPRPVASETAAPTEEKLFDNGNIAGVQNAPTKETQFTLDKTRHITKISDYHWNKATGSTPGTIGLKDASGKTYGPWQATGRDGQGGVKNAYWDTAPDFDLPAGTYTVIDSEPATWAQNSGSEGAGMTSVWGY